MSGDLFGPGRVHHRGVIDPNTGKEAVTTDGFDLLKGSADPGSHAQAAEALRGMPTADQLSPTAQDTPEARAAREAQQRALSALQGEVASGGWSPEERKAATHMAAISVGLAAGHRAAAQQQMVARGMSPGLAASLAAKVGQQQQAQSGYQSGLAGEAGAQKRVDFAQQAVASQANQMQQDALGQGQFNTAQQDAGDLRRMAAEQNESAYGIQRDDSNRSAAVGGATTVGMGLLGAGKAAGANYEESQGLPK